MEFRGFVDDIGSALGEMDVFGYPSCRESFAASELALQEAMYAGLPSVVLGPPAIHRLVHHRSTGLIAETPAEYSQALTYLYRTPRERARMGAAARAHAVADWSLARVRTRWAETYAQLLELPKRTRSPYPLASRGALRFTDSLGAGAEPFLTSLSGPETDALEAERAITRSPGCCVPAMEAS